MPKQEQLEILISCTKTEISWVLKGPLTFLSLLVETPHFEVLPAILRSIFSVCASFTYLRSLSLAPHFISWESRRLFYFSCAYQQFHLCDFGERWIQTVQD